MDTDCTKQTYLKYSDGNKTCQESSINCGS